MNETLALVVAWAAGLLLGGVFFGGLWWTVRAAVASQRPARWFVGSWLLRMSMALAGFYLVGYANWQRLIVCLLGFIMARVIVKWLTRPAGESKTRRAPEAPHAP